MPQFARPNSDFTANWNPSTGNDRFAVIDEASADDNDFISTGNNPSSLICTVGLSAIEDPVSSTGHVVRWRYRKAPSGARVIDLTVDLLEGASTVRATKTLTNITSTAFTPDSIPLTTGEADAIGSYSALRLRFTANATGGGSPSGADISWAEFEAPDPPTPQAPVLIMLRPMANRIQHMLVR